MRSRSSVLFQALLIAVAIASLAQGIVYSVKEGREGIFLKRKFFTNVTRNPNELELLKQSLAIAFELPSHKSPNFDPNYGLANPLYRFFGPPASVIATRGGHCGRRARLLISLLHTQGIPARKVFLINGGFARYGHRDEYVHAVVEAKVGDDWVVADPLFNILYTDNLGNPVGLERIRQDTMIFAKGVADANEQYVSYPESLYTYNEYRRFNWSDMPFGSHLYYSLVGVVGKKRANNMEEPKILETPNRAIAILSFATHVTCVLLLVKFTRRKARPKPQTAKRSFRPSSSPGPR
jgi:hypothetical protein